MGPTLSNLDKLLQVPTGCGEQNMLGMVPNILVMQYLESTEQLTPNVADKVGIGVQLVLVIFRLLIASFNGTGHHW